MTAWARNANAYIRSRSQTGGGATFTYQTGRRENFASEHARQVRSPAPIRRDAGFERLPLHLRSAHAVLPATVSAAAAIASAGRFVRKFWLSQRNFEQSVHAVSHRVLRYERVLYVVRRRELALHIIPGLNTRRADVRPLPDLARDPWRVDPAELPQATRCVAACPTCNGTKRVPCTGCGGGGRNACSLCRGSGRVLGQRGTKICPDCRGGGTVRCRTCTGGLVGCDICRGTGRVIAWAEVQQVDISQVVSDASDIIARGHPGLHDVNDFEGVSSARLLSDATSTSSFAQPMGGGIELDARRDRLISERRQVLELDCFDVAWTVATGSGVISVLGAQLVVDPLSATHALRRRRTRALVGAGTIAVATGALTLFYVSQHAWFAAHGAQDRLLTLGTLLSILALFIMLEANLGTQVRRPRRIWMGLGGMLVTGLAFAYVYLGSGPQIVSIERHLLAGALADARLEANAFLVTEGARLEAHARLDDLQHRELDAADTLASKASIAARGWHIPANGAAAADRIKDLALAAFASIETGGSATSVDEILRITSWLPAHVQEELQARAALANVALCAGGDPAPCLEARLASARALGVDDGALAPHLRTATATLQGRIENALRVTKQGDPRLHRDNVALARSTALVLRAATRAESRPRVDVIATLLTRAERDLATAEAREAHRAKLAAERDARVKAAAARRAENAARAARSSQVIKQRIIADSIDSYSGSCPCPYNTASNGTSCGGRSAYSRVGGASPLCYASDISDDMVENYRQRHQL